MKKEYTLKTGFDEVPFPQQGKTQALREEDAFMELHGKPWIVATLWTGVKATLNKTLYFSRRKKTVTNGQLSEPS